jgi:hypothetical protein
MLIAVIPVKTGIQFLNFLDSGICRNDLFILSVVCGEDGAGGSIYVRSFAPNFCSMVRIMAAQSGSISFSVKVVSLDRNWTL